FGSPCTFNCATIKRALKTWLSLIALRLVQARNQTKPFGFVAHRKINGFYIELLTHYRAMSRILSFT
ncbi:MAG: hypothetical protein WC122_03690, partial [archaeon]